MMTQSTSSSKTERLAQRLKEVNRTIGEVIHQNEPLKSAHQTLQRLINQLEIGKPRLVIASQTPEIAEAVQTALSHDRPWVGAYQVEWVMLPPHPTAETRVHLQTQWQCDVWCLAVRKTSDASALQWGMPPDETHPLTQTQILSLDDLEQNAPVWVNWCQKLELGVKRKPEEWLIKRVTAHGLKQLEFVAASLQDAEVGLNNQIAVAQAQLDQANQSRDLKVITEAEYRLNAIQQDIIPTFKELENSLDQSRETLLDSYYRYSLVHQIQAFTDTLQPVILRRGGSQYIQLQTDHLIRSTDINVDLVHLCYGRLSQWAMETWQNLCSGYNRGGISHLLQRIEIALGAIPGDRQGRPVPTASSNRYTFQQLLKGNVAGISCETYYKEVSVVHYMMRQIRSQWMGLMFLFTFISMIGIGASSNKRSMIQSAIAPLYQLIDRPWLMILVLSGIFCPLFLWLFYSHHVDSQVKLEDESEKLRKRLFDYYRKFAEISAEKICKDLKGALLVERELVQQQLQWAMNYLATHKTEAEQQKYALHHDIEQLQTQQKNLGKIRDEVNKARSRLV